MHLFLKVFIQLGFVIPLTGSSFRYLSRLELSFLFHTLDDESCNNKVESIIVTRKSELPIYLIFGTMIPRTIMLFDFKALLM